MSHPVDSDPVPYSPVPDSPIPAPIDERTDRARMADSLGTLVDAVATADRIIAQASALRAGVIDQVRLWSEITENTAALMTESTSGPGWNSNTVAARVVVSELACVLRIPERTAETLVEQSRALLHELPATMEALKAGEISYRHAEKMIDHAGSVPEGAREAFEVSLLPQARRLTVSKFDWKARVARERAHPESITARHEASAQDRNVQVRPGRDGMAWLVANLPAHRAQGIFNRLKLSTGSRHGAQPAQAG